MTFLLSKNVEKNFFWKQKCVQSHSFYIIFKYLCHDFSVFDIQKVNNY